ncbi:hypothetical protein [Brasilonema bromeliae]|uniref:PEP-CTERM sorting domain-containing protein n=1 Tax=Brasilonema bromeliae SPC951 TaxID=385972 RepID=A0ABX1PF21_9CYAN|nr:hypothetical protein [Brasilonema bromeliae]NMG22085.1 hypothetical protein [Brasilonema bromeliae SPC951]
MNLIHFWKSYFALTSNFLVSIVPATQLITLLGLLLGVHQTASAATLTFEQASVGTLSTYTESGFTTSAVSGPWAVSDSYGKPAPFIQFRKEAGLNPLTATIQITNDDSKFTFGSVDLYSSVTPIPYVITGSLNSTAIFSFEGTVPNTFGNFKTVVNPNSNYLIDSLIISLTNPAVTCCSNPMGLDNITVTPISTTSVPEPNSSLFSLLGLPVVTWLSRRNLTPGSTIRRDKKLS